MIVWESDSKNANGKSFLTVHQDGSFVYAERLGRDSVAFILIDNDREDGFGVVQEYKPPLYERVGSEIKLHTAFGGSLDKDIMLSELVTEEALEESGYSVSEDRVQDHGSVMVSTQMNQFCHLFSVDVTGLEQGKMTTDDVMEMDNEVIWYTFDGLFDLQDWKAPLIGTKYIRASQV